MTGSSGQLGVALTAAAPAWATVTGAKRDDLDVSNFHAVAEAIDALAPELVINAAAYTDVEAAESDRQAALAVNADGAENLARAAKTAGCRLLHISTDYVFPGSDGAAALQPDHPTRAINVYGATKLEGERRVTAHLGAQALIFRTSWLYNPGGRNFVSTMLRLMNARPTVKVVADQFAAPTSAATLAAVIWRAVENRLTGIHHWCDAGVASWYDFATAIYEIGRANNLIDRDVCIVPVTTAEYPTKAARPSFSLLDTRSTHAALDLPWVHWRDILKSALETYPNA